MEVGGQRHASRKTQYPLYERLDEPQGWSARMRKISPPPGFDPRIVQPVASRYTDWAIYATRTVLYNGSNAQDEELLNTSVFESGCQELWFSANVSWA